MTARSRAVFAVVITLVLAAPALVGIANSHRTPSGLAPTFRSASSAVYPVTFTESGLPNGTTWTVILGSETESSSGAQVEFNMTNGTYLAQFPAIPAGPGFEWIAHDLVGVPVNGSSYSTTEAFSRIAVFPVQIDEQGLPTATNWSVTLLGGSATGLWNPTFSNTTVSAGAGVTGTISLLEPASLLVPDPSAAGYALLGFTGTGCPNLATGATVAGPTVWLASFGTSAASLPTGCLHFAQSAVLKSEIYSRVAWSVTLKAASGGVALPLLTTGSMLSASAPCDTAYDYTVLVPSLTYKVQHPNGHLRANWCSTNLTKTVKFKLLAERVVFKETGLAAGSSWTVTITNVSAAALALPLQGTRMAGQGAVSFKLPLGTYAYSITYTGTRAPTTASGTITVSQAPSPAQLVEVTFS